jgi:chitin disaccharide deacetylase
MKNLIINADDFGKFHTVNEGIIEGVKKGVITSTSVLVYGKYASEIKNLSNNSNISIGLHFDPSKHKPEEYRDEFYKQIDNFVKLVGRNPDHIDSHKIRLHEMVEILEDIKNYASTINIPLRDMGYAHFIDSFFGLSTIDYKTTDPNRVSPNTLLNILKTELKDGFNELMCHAGRVNDEVMKNSTYNSAREIELNTLLSNKFANFLKNNPEIKLCSWKDLSL